MKFNLSTEFVVVVFLFVSIMIVSTYGSVKVRPFQQVSSKLSMYPYRDGYENKSDSETVSEPPEEMLEYLKKPSPTYNKIPASKPKSEGFETISTKLVWGNYGTQEKPLDIMSQLPSSPDCATGSSGLSNSRGYLCPSNEVKRLYGSRGGNSSGQPYQIGA